MSEYLGKPNEYYMLRRAARRLAERFVSCHDFDWGKLYTPAYTKTTCQSYGTCDREGASMTDNVRREDFLALLVVALVLMCGCARTRAYNVRATAKCRETHTEEECKVLNYPACDPGGTQCHN